MSAEKLEQVLSKLDEMGLDINELKSGQSRMEERMTTMGTRMTTMDESIEELKAGQQVLTDGQRGLRKEIDTRFNEAKDRFDHVDRQIRLLDVDFSGIEEKMKDHDRDIHRLKNL